jgi:tRNA(adenine34) deaminase
MTNICFRYSKIKLATQLKETPDKIGGNKTKTKKIQLKISTQNREIGELIDQHTIDVKFMRLALKEARLAAEADEVPVGAVVVQGGEVIAWGRNRIRELRDPSAHAEIVAIRAAGKKLNRERLTEATLYTTLEPCAMCAGALVLARVKRVVFASSDPKAGAGGSIMDLLRHPKLNHRIEVTGEVLAGTARQLLVRFFKSKRKVH